MVYRNGHLLLLWCTLNMVNQFKYKQIGHIEVILKHEKYVQICNSTCDVVAVV